jgi:hypothetical protein
MGVNGITLQPTISVSGQARACYQDPTGLVSRVLTSLDPGLLPEGP